MFGYGLSGNQWEIPPSFSKAWPFQEKAARVTVGKSHYLINPKGKYLTSEAYDYIGWANDAGSNFDAHFYEGVIGFKKGRLWGLINQKGKVMVPATYAAIFAPENGLLKIAQYAPERELLLYGIINSQGEIKVAPIHEALDTSFGKQLAKTGKYIEPHGWLWGIINTDGTTILTEAFIELKQSLPNLFVATDTSSFLALYQIEQNGKAMRVTPHHFQGLSEFVNGFAAAVKEGRWGVIDHSGKEVLPFIHRHIDYSDSVWVAQKYPAFQLTSLDGNAETTFHYDKIENIGPNLFRFGLNGVSGLITDKMEVVSIGQFDQINYLSSGNYWVEKGGKTGIISATGKVIIPLQKQEIEAESNGWRVTHSNSSVTFHLPDGTEVPLQAYSQLGRFKGNRCRVVRNGKVGYLNTRYQEAIACNYLDGEDFTGNQAVVRTSSGLYGAIDSTGTFIIRPHLDTLATFSEGHFLYREGRFWGTLDHQGIEGSKGFEAHYQITNEGSILVEANGKYGLVNAVGKSVLPIQYDSIRFLETDLCLIWQSGTRMFMPLQSREVPTPNLYSVYDTVWLPTEGMAATSQKGRWGFIDHMGRMLITVQYDSVLPFSNGMAPVLIDGGWGYLNTNGTLVVQPRYPKPQPYGKTGVVLDKKGKKLVLGFNSEVILKAEYDRIEISQYGNWLVEQNQKWGIYTANGLTGIYPKYDFIADMGNGYVITRNNGKYGFDRIDGFSVVFPTSDMVVFNPFNQSFFLITAPSEFSWNPWQPAQKSK